MKNILWLSEQDILKLNTVNIGTVMEVIERTLLEYSRGEIRLHNKNSYIFDSTTQARINCMVSALEKYNVCGMKWVSVFPNNPIHYNLRNSSSTVILSELETGYPKAFLDFTLGTALRTAAINAVAAKVLAKENSQVIGLIGSGVQAKFNFQALKYVRPEIKKCYISSRSETSEEKLKKALQEQYNDVEFVCCKNNCGEAAKHADIIVTATSAQAPLLKAKDIKEGALYCHVAGYEDEYEVAKKADKIICDSWNDVKHRSQTISRMYLEGVLHDDDIYGDLWEIITENKLGRENETEFIYFNSVGLPYLDVAIADYFYGEAQKCGVGSLLEKKEIDMFNDEAINKMML